MAIRGQNECRNGGQSRKIKLVIWQDLVKEKKTEGLIFDFLVFKGIIRMRELQNSSKVDITHESDTWFDFWICLILFNLFCRYASCLAGKKSVVLNLRLNNLWFKKTFVRIFYYMLFSPERSLCSLYLLIRLMKRYLFEIFSTRG